MTFSSLLRHPTRYVTNIFHTERVLTVNFNKTEFLAINTGQDFHINIEENFAIKQVQHFKQLSVSLNKKGMIPKNIENKISKGRQIIACLNSLWWDKNVYLWTQKSAEKNLWLNQWLGMDVKYGFLRQRKTNICRNGLFKEVSQCVRVTK